MNACRHATVLAWLDRFPGAVLESRATLLLVKAWVLALAGRGDEALRVAAAVDARPRRARGGRARGGAAAGRHQLDRRRA